MASSPLKEEEEGGVFPPLFRVYSQYTSTYCCTQTYHRTIKRPFVLKIHRFGVAGEDLVTSQP